MVKPTPDVSCNDQYNLGCLYALFAAAAQSDTRASAERAKPLDRIARIAGARLVEVADRSGFFRDRASCEYAKRDPDLAILANRDEFRTMVDRPVADP